MDQPGSGWLTAAVNRGNGKKVRHWSSVGRSVQTEKIQKYKYTSEIQQIGDEEVRKPRYYT